MITKKQNLKEGVSNLSAYAIFIYGFVLISPLFSILFKGASFVLSIALVVVVVLIAIKSNFKYSFKFLISIFLILLVSQLLVLSSEDISYMTDIRYLLIAAILVYSVTFSTIYKVVEIASTFILILLLGGSIAFILSMIGYGDIGSFANPDGRENHIYFFTFSNAGWSGLVRPAGIYDEPGAFSFFISGIAAARHLLRMDNKQTWIILLLGLQTLSVAHVVYMAFHAFASQNINLKLLIKSGMIFLFVNVIAFLDKTNIIYHQFLERFVKVGFDRGGFGEGRLLNIVRSFDYLVDNPEIFLIGVRGLYHDAGGYLHYWTTMSVEYGGSFGGNILFPIVTNGFVNSAPYLFIILSLVVAPLFKGRFYAVSIGVTALIYNRDYMYVISYSLVVLMIYRIIYEQKKTYVK
jgi:hypothetical protein